MVDENPNESLIDLAAVVERVRPQLGKTLEAYRIPVADSEDLVQEALLAMLTEWDDIGNPGPSCGWRPAASVPPLCAAAPQEPGSEAYLAVLERLTGARPGRAKQHGNPPRSPTPTAGAFTPAATAPPAELLAGARHTRALLRARRRRRWRGEKLRLFHGSWLIAGSRQEEKTHTLGTLASPGPVQSC